MDIFIREMAEGKAYRYVCGRTDIQAAQMSGFSQPDGRCVLLINDIYGTNSLGEACRMTLSRLGARLLVMLWHPSVASIWDHFMVHRQPSAWPAPAAHLMQYFVRTEAEAAFVEFDRTETATQRAIAAIDSPTPLVVVTMLPPHECGVVPLDVRARA